MLSCCLTSPQWARGCPAAPGRGQEGTEPRSRAHPAPAAPALTFCPDKPWKRKARGGLRGRLPALRTPMCWGGEGLTGFPESPGSPRGPGGPASPCGGTWGCHTWPQQRISQPCSLISSPFPRLLFAGVFCTKGEESTPNTNPCPVPPHPTGTCGPLGPGLPGTPWGPCLP